MIKGTIVKINRVVQKSPTVTQKNYSEMSSREMLNTVIAKDTGWEFIKIKTLSFKSETEAYISFSQKIKDPKIEKQRSELGLLLHNNQTLESSKSVELLHEVEKDRLERVSIANPLWKGHSGVKRNIERRTLDVGVTAAMQSQLFAMLESNASDSNWMNSFSLKDFQQTKMYKWQDQNLPSGSNMTPQEMTRLMRNVLSSAKLPWITIEFKEKGHACMFAITRSGGKTLVISQSQDEDDSSEWGWLHNLKDRGYETLGEANEGYRIRISDMRLVMIMSWAMNSSVLLHEIAHYITFVFPTNYKVNKGNISLNLKDYTNLFAGHGALYMAVFSRLLIDFAYIKEDSLYESIKSDGLAWFPIKSLSVKDVDAGIERYLSHKK